ncbi:MAG: triose-phosphate isomerase [Candidatus Cloacimonadaceae bacterium]|nr:triose-phosphate isomerase [Candidatus Cloacimonadaceae bacterium]
MRNIIIAGNWKMNKDLVETRDFCSQLAQIGVSNHEDRVQTLVAPAFPFLKSALCALSNSQVLVAAQDVSVNDHGAFTGEVSVSMLASLEIKHCIIGHSERRQYHNETDAMVNRKLKKLLSANLKPIVCIGETLKQRDAGETNSIILSQLAGCFEDVGLNTGLECVIAYEPVWAIGTGRTATSIQAEEVHALIRDWLGKRYSIDIAENTHILYGGSVKAENIIDLLFQKDIDGALIGGASLKIDDFTFMITAAKEVIRARSGEKK